MVRQILQRVVLLIAVLTFVSPCFVNAAQNDQGTDTGPVVAWQAFRRLHPFHIQAVALSREYEDGSRVLVVSEPPPHVTVEGLNGVDSALLATGRVMTHRFGHDGWVKDVVFNLPRLDEKRLEALLRGLHRYLYFTDYKAHTIDLGELSEPPTSSLDLRVTVAELELWLQRENELFDSTPKSPGDEKALSELLESDQCDVFLSKTPGLVVWIIPHAHDLAKSQAVIRRFALDSDLIIGAVKGTKATAVVGRQRDSSLLAVPPLRTETVLLLAAVKTKELSQSYERNHLLAGRFDDSHDWAPILLSPELWHTELGSLLNVTDQILKSWSSQGLTSYERFNYPHPTIWPFKRPLASIVQGGSLLYNWNTRGAAYSVDTGSFRFVAANRTGGLPVSYAAGDTFLPEFETPAYEYFAGLSDANLVRVVQYTMLYQIFRDCDISSSTNVPRLNDPGVSASKTEISKILTTFCNADEEEIQGASKRIVDRALASISALERLFVDRQAATAQTEGMIRKLKEQLEALRREDGFDVERIASVFASWRREAPRLSISRLEQLSTLAKGNSVLQAFADTREVRDRYASAFDNPTDSWIRTPSIVVSWSRGVLATWVGGHNVDARLSRFRLAKSEETVEKGKPIPVLENGELVLVFHRDDVRIAHKLLDELSKQRATLPRTPLGVRLPESRRIEIAKRTADLLRDIPPEESALRSRNNALLLSERLLAGMPSEGALVPPKVQADWTQRPRSETESELLENFAHLPDSVVVIERQQDHYAIYSRGSDKTYMAATTQSTVEYLARNHRRLAPQGALRLNFVNFKEHEVQNVLDSSRAGSARPIQRVELASPGRSDPESTARAFAEKYDFGSVKATPVRLESLGSGGTRAILSVEVPCQKADVEPLRIRVTIMFRNLVTGAGRSKVDQAANDAMKLVPKGSASEKALPAFQEELRRALKTLGESEEIDVTLELEAAGIRVTVVPRSNENLNHARPHCDAA